MEKIKFNIADVIVKNLDGEVLPVHFGKFLGNFIYTAMPDLDWLEIAKAIHAGQEIELTDEQANKLRNIVTSNECNLIMAVKDAIITHIEKLLKPTEKAKNIEPPAKTPKVKKTAKHKTTEEAEKPPKAKRKYTFRGKA